MQATTPETTQTIADGGFRIRIGPEEFTVVADKSAWKARRPAATWIRFVLLGLVLTYYLLDKPSTSNGLLVFAVFAIALLPSFIFGYLRGINNIRCTRENLEVLRVIRGRQAETCTFQRNLVKQVRFAVVSQSRYGSMHAIVFEVDEKKVKVLRGIEIPEAQAVLQQFDRFGYDTVRDVGMPMAVEMALERRKSWLGF